MDFQGNLTGCSLSFSAAGNSATISCTGGNVHFANGSVHTVVPSSITVNLGDKARCVRVYITGVKPSPTVTTGSAFASAYIAKEYANLSVDDDQEALRGVYPAGLVVIGHVELPAKSGPVQTISDSDSAMGSRERASMLRIIRALAEMAKLKDRGSASPIEKQLQALGFDGPKESTIREILKEARELDPDRTGT